MMLRLAPAVSPNRVAVVPPPSSTRIPTFAAPRHQLVTRNGKAPNFTSLRCSSNVNASNSSVVAKPLKSEIKSALDPPECPDGFPFTRIEGDVMSGELNGEEIHVWISTPFTITQDLPECESTGGVCLPDAMILAVKNIKGNGISVFFWVELWPDDMEVHFFVVKSPGMPEALRISMKEEEAGKWDSALQEYLEARGIKPCYAEYFYRYMVYRHLHMALKSSYPEDW